MAIKVLKKKGDSSKAASSKSKKMVYFFGDGKADGKGSQKSLLGGKGANLAEMALIGLPVPAGMTITTEVCNHYYDSGKKWPGELQGQIDRNIAKIEKVMGKKFGDLDNPLLLSVRSGARESMPGMMDTILNLGINDRVVSASWKQRPATPVLPGTVTVVFSRCMAMSSWVWKNTRANTMILSKKFWTTLKEAKGVQDDTDLSADDLEGNRRKIQSADQRTDWKEFSSGSHDPAQRRD